MSPRRGTALRRALLACALVLVLAAVAAGGFAAWGLNAYRAEPGPLGEALALPAVEVEVADDAVVLAPAGGGTGTGVVFYPGARVEAEAYAAPWAPVVRDTGVTVVIPRMPLNFAVLAPDRADRAIADHGGGVDRWYLGGHSLGGAMAASHAGGDPDPAPAGLILWGSYATEGAGLAGRDDLRVLSVSGGEDALSDPATVAANRGHLPPDAESVEIEGMNHAQFGAYGEQSGDGTADIGDAEARAALAAAVTAFLDG
ncbi:Alpha/beta hydrolase family protein [Nocardiopsis flavescens]|uniref:Alpha/beta hydrolase family protein n=1 Tax=Nocardiopsis flavescens TaxID=758803 RepID=A0A1M6UDV9_9ACTN|nr:alpha/beta hydrolase [Nocardiopsis flavescens]SHK67357.1 Alpha/beta hydrolase family protein [Nocardiopsis flavescens]